MKDDIIELTGKVDDLLPGSKFKVILDEPNIMITCYLGGKLKKHKIRISRGDSVKVELSPYDLNLGRITYRL